MISYLLISINILKPPKGVTELIGRIQKDSPWKEQKEMEEYISNSEVYNIKLIF